VILAPQGTVRGLLADQLRDEWAEVLRARPRWSLVGARAARFAVVAVARLGLVALAAPWLFLWAAWVAFGWRRRHGRPGRPR
jgi:hypothetical protein